MDKQKKGIIAGASILGAGLIAYFATRKAKEKPPVLEITLSNLAITPTTVSPGEAVIISVLATNHSASALSTTVNLKGDFTDSKPVTLAAGASQTVTFTVTPTTEKTYNVSVDSLSGSFVCTSAPHGDIQLSDLVISPASCIEGDTVTISVTATNNGNANEVMAVTLKLAGSKYSDTAQEIQQIILEPGKSRTVTFTFQPLVAETYAVTVDGLSGSLVVNSAPTWPGWTAGTFVDGITATPTILYLGQTVTIAVAIEWPLPGILPTNIEASVDVDGTTLSKVLSIDFRNPSILFTYTPTKVGEYTVTAQDKTATFTVLENAVGTFYSPFGGTRMPLCTDIVVHNVAPFDTFSGGDLILKSMFPSLFISRIPEVIGRGPGYPTTTSKLAAATPRTWAPAEATVSEWASEYAFGSGFGLSIGNVGLLLIMATQYSCQSYWNSKDELANMIATRPSGAVFPVLPTDWIPIYGTTCPTCGGTGTVLEWGRWPTKCPTCKGLGKILLVDLSIGLRDWVKPITWNSFEYANTPFTLQIKCPYCNQWVTRTYSDNPGNSGKLDVSRDLLEHIETVHPDHPLTSPAWF